MKPVELRDLNDAELAERFGELREELFNLRFQFATGQLDNHRRMRLVKQDIARARTIMRERELAELNELAAQAVGEGAENE